MLMIYIFRVGKKSYQKYEMQIAINPITELTNPHYLRIVVVFSLLPKHYSDY